MRLHTRGGSSEARVKLATGILKAAAEGERDPARLRAAGLFALRSAISQPGNKPAAPATRRDGGARHAVH